MASQIRSPRYPIIGLREALEKARAVYDVDHRNRIPKELVAKHIGYNSLNGKSLGVISAIGKYGLLEGRADQMWISDRAIDIFEHEQSAPERVAAIKAAASEPELYQELASAFPGKVSDAALRSFLITKRKFLPDAADRAIRSYRETRELVDEELKGYDGDLGEPDQRAMQTATETPATPLGNSKPEQLSPFRVGNNPFEPGYPPRGTRREVITLDEGDVVIMFPENLSVDSFGDLKDHLDLFIKKMQRRARAVEPGGEAPISQAPKVTEESSQSGGIPFMITQDMKARLRAAGLSEEEIRNMSPQQAHDLLEVLE
jgi:hypothetical protein